MKLAALALIALASVAQPSGSDKLVVIYGGDIWPGITSPSATLQITPPMRDLHIRVGPVVTRKPFYGRIANLDTLNDSPITIKLLVVYTSEVEKQLGTIDKINSDVYTGIAQFNKTLRNTGFTAVMEVVDIAKIERSCTTWETCQFDRTDSMSFFHAAITHDREIARLRDEKEADLVVGWAWSYDGSIAGVSYILTTMVPVPGRWEPSEYGYAVVAAQYAVTWPVLVHELGHTLGLAHNIESTQGPGLTPYAYGWLDPLNRFQCPMTIGPNPILWQYSSNTIKFDGIATGGPNADAASVLSYSLPRVACYRGPCKSSQFVIPWK